MGKLHRQYVLNSEEDTKKLAAFIAPEIKAGDILTFTGDLGAGKTFICREIIKSLASQKTEVTSPTFNIVLTYATPEFTIYHFDLYRIKYPEEVYELGIDEAFSGKSVCLIEWPEILRDFLPSRVISVNIQIDGEARLVSIKFP